MHPAYFRVRFRSPFPIEKFPTEFVIVTAYATTGEQWSDERNRKSDALLAEKLVSEGYRHCRIEGYSPETGHSEPGWAVETDVQRGCQLGQTFIQDAIYHVLNDNVVVVECKEPYEKAVVGSFRTMFDYESMND